MSHVSGGWVSWPSCITLGKRDCIFTVQFYQTQGTFSPRPSYSVIAIGIRQAGKSMLFAKLSGTILKKLKPTVGKLFLRVSMFEYTFQIYHFELTFVKCRKKFIYSDVGEHMITILLSESEKRFSQFV